MRLSDPETYCSAAAACVLLFLLAPPAGLLMGVMVLMCAIDDQVSQPPKQCWKIEEETGLETLYACRCHESMGNDFYFLPKGQCLYDRCNRSYK